MLKYLLILILYIFSTKVIISQNNIDFQIFENKSTEYLENKKWDSLINICKMAISNDIDYYYLRLRFGIAHFNKKNYISAIKEFEKALEFNSLDTISYEYIYYSYIYLNREEDAILYSKFFPKEITNKLKIKKSKIVEFIYSENGFHANSSSIKPHNLKENQILIYYDNPSSINYNFLGIKSRLNYKMTIFQGVSLLSSKNVFDFTVRTSPTTFNNYQSNNEIKQFQYYINPKYNLKVGLKIISYFHYINVNGSSNLTFYDEQIQKSTFDTIPINFNNYVFGIGVEKNFKKLKFLTNMSYNNLNNNKHIQGSIGITFPFFVNNLYLNYSLIFNNAIGKISENIDKLNYINKVKLSYKINQYFYLENSFYSGNIQNCHLNDGFLIYNSYNKYNYLTNTLLSYTYNKFTIMASYQGSNQIGVKYIYTDNNGKIEQEINNFNYKNHSIIGGILWKF